MYSQEDLGSVRSESGGPLGGKILFNSYILEVKAFDKSTPKSLLSNKLKSTAVAGSQSKA